MNLNENDKMAAARILAINKMPYYRAAIFLMTPRRLPGYGTFGVSKGGVMFYDPGILAIWTVEQTGMVLLHEVSHLLRNHADRREVLYADSIEWNLAGDAEINDDLREIGDFPPLPDGSTGGVFPETFGMEVGLTAEEYYQAIKEQKKTSKSIENWVSGSRSVCAGQCGGCAGNPINEEEETAADAEEGRSKVELKRMQRTVAEAALAEMSKGRGKIPNGVARWVGDLFKPPQISWQQKLAKIVRGSIAYRTGVVDCRFSRPSRRQAGIGYGVGVPILPALISPQPKITIAIDTSGSMGEEELRHAVAETSGVIKAVGGYVDLCVCDAEVHTLRPIRNLSGIAGMLIGGGGTDFNPVFEEVSKRRNKPDVLIFITDGQGPAPEVAPKFKVIWVLVGPYRERPTIWGDVIEIEKT